MISPSSKETVSGWWANLISSSTWSSPILLTSYPMEVSACRAERWCAWTKENGIRAVHRNTSTSLMKRGFRLAGNIWRRMVPFGYREPITISSPWQTSWRNWDSKSWMSLRGLRQIRRPISRADTLLTPPSSLSGQERRRRCRIITTTSWWKNWMMTSGCMAPACHRKMGEIAGQASYPEAARPPCSHHSGFYQTGGLDSRPIRRQQYHRHRCQSAGPPLPGHRPGKAVSGTEQGKKRGTGIADDSPRLPASHQGYRGDGENGSAGRYASRLHSRGRNAGLRLAILRERIFLTQACASSKVETRRKNGAYTPKKWLNYSVTQLLSFFLDPYTWNLVTNWKYIFYIIYLKYIIYYLYRKKYTSRIKLSNWVTE